MNVGRISPLIIFDLYTRAPQPYLDYYQGLKLKNIGGGLGYFIENSM